MSLEDDRIEQLKRRLYSRTVKPVLDQRESLGEPDISAPGSWGDETLHIPDDMTTASTHPFVKKFLLVAVIFFVVALGVAGYIFFGGSNLISSSNVNIEAAGPISIASGQETDLSVSITNQNAADLQFATLSIDYPDGSFVDAESSKMLTRDVQDVGTVAKGATVNRTVSAYIFGNKGDTKTIKLTLSYKLAGSNAVFTKEKDYQMTIASSPVIVNVSGPTDTNSGQSITFTATVTSNSTALLKNIRLAVAYPYGFVFSNSSPGSPYGKNGVWDLGDMKSGDTKTITITGTLSAQDGEERTFQFAVGPAGAITSDPSQALDTVLSQSAATVAVAKPFISSSMTVAGQTGDTAAITTGQSVSGSLTFGNTLPTALTDVSVSLAFSGNALDIASVNGDGGFYQSANQTVSWDKNSLPALASLTPGDSQDLAFSFNTLRLSANAKNPQVNILATITGTRTSSDGSTGSVTATVNKSVKVDADLSLLEHTLRNGPITNSGPVPPRSNQSTTYTIQWTLTNIWNDVSGAKVTATLPPYIDWTGQVSPSTAPISYDSSTRTVTWSPDAVSAGSGVSLSPMQVYFQVRLNASLSQLGSTPALESSPQVTAHDTFTNDTLSFTATPLTSATSDTGDSGKVGN